jgi:HlyD family secretion protein
MMSGRKILILALVVILGTSVVLGRWLWIAASTTDPDRIKVSGNIEVIDVQMSFKIPGRVEQRLFDEGQWVEKDQVVAVLETGDLQQNAAMRQADLHTAEAALAEMLAGSRPEELTAAKAQMEKAAALVAEMKAGSRPQEIAVAEATLASATVDRERLEAEYQRAERLHKEHVNAPEDYDRARAAYHVAEAKQRDAKFRLDLAVEGPRIEEKQQAEEALRQARAQYEMVKIGPRKEDIDQARAKLEQAKAALALAQTQLGYATLRAPMAGVVVSKNIEPGEYVSPGTAVLTIGDLKHVWLRAYITERDHVRVKFGQRAEVVTDTDPGKIYVGRVSFISPEAEFTPKTVQTQQERVKLVYRIKIDIDNPNLELKPGTPADADILVHQGQGDEGTEGQRDRGRKKNAESTRGWQAEGFPAVLP